MNSNTTMSNAVARPARPARPNSTIQNPREAAQFISDMSLELRNLAKANHLLTLQGLLEVAYYEAFSAASKREIPPGEIEHLKELSRASLG